MIGRAKWLVVGLLVVGQLFGVNVEASGEPASATKIVKVKIVVEAPNGARWAAEGLRVETLELGAFTTDERGSIELRVPRGYLGHIHVRRVVWQAMVGNKYVRNWVTLHRLTQPRAGGASEKTRQFALQPMAFWNPRMVGVDPAFEHEEKELIFPVVHHRVCLKDRDDKSTAGQVNVLPLENPKVGYVSLVFPPGASDPGAGPSEDPEGTQDLLLPLREGGQPPCGGLILSTVRTSGAREEMSSHVRVVPVPRQRQLLTARMGIEEIEMRQRVHKAIGETERLTQAQMDRLRRVQVIFAATYGLVFRDAVGNPLFRPARYDHWLPGELYLPPDYSFQTPDRCELYFHEWWHAVQDVCGIVSSGGAHSQPFSPCDDPLMALSEGMANLCGVVLGQLLRTGDVGPEYAGKVLEHLNSCSATYRGQPRGVWEDGIFTAALLQHYTMTVGNDPARMLSRMIGDAIANSTVDRADTFFQNISAGTDADALNRKRQMSVLYRLIVPAPANAFAVAIVDVVSGKPPMKAMRADTSVNLKAHLLFDGRPLLGSWTEVLELDWHTLEAGTKTLKANEPFTFRAPAPGTRRTISVTLRRRNPVDGPEILATSQIEIETGLEKAAELPETTAESRVDAASGTGEWASPKISVAASDQWEVSRGRDEVSLTRRHLKRQRLFPDDAGVMKLADSAQAGGSISLRWLTPPVPRTAEAGCGHRTTSSLRCPAS
ncbi:MAG TPA: hypothetical protein PKO06_13360 [Candidatus Ozemobacteraceae bacterium]|nr:hypothetical protein [Candidatus Ozemobacteraceae bacterium]